VRPNPDLNKIEAYECGFKPAVSVRLPFEVHFYRVAILFLLFDVEISFLFPWAVCFNNITIVGHLSVFFLISILLWGFLFEYLMKVFD
jgi:NADH-quinone oxidoreductase subunit A